MRWGPEEKQKVEERRILSLRLTAWAVTLVFSCSWIGTYTIGSETGWDLGPFAAVLASGHSLLEQQNTKKLYGTKNNCVHAQLGQILDKRYKKTKKAQLPLLKTQKQKHGVGSKSRVLCVPPARTTTKRWTDHLSHPSSLTPGHNSTLTPI